jgi:hypothetical protein
MHTLATERLHVDGLVIQLVQIDRDTFTIVTVNDQTGLSWPASFNGATVERWKEYVDGVLRDAKHHCLQLGCPDWVDSPSSA